MKVITSINIDKALLDELRKEAAKQKRSLSNYIALKLSK